MHFDLTVASGGLCFREMKALRPRNALPGLLIAALLMLAKYLGAV